MAFCNDLLQTAQLISWILWLTRLIIKAGTLVVSMRLRCCTPVRHDNLIPRSWPDDERGNRLMSPCPGEHATGQDRRPPSVDTSHSRVDEEPVGRAGQDWKSLWDRNSLSYCILHRRWSFFAPFIWYWCFLCLTMLGTWAAQITCSVCRFLANMRGSVALEYPAWSRLYAGWSTYTTQ